MTEWILALMLALSPASVTPWAASYPETARAIAKAATEEPLYGGAFARERTAATLVAVAFFESTFKPGALGDKSTSVGRYQINQSNFAALGITKAQLLADPDVEVRAALRMMRDSFAICKGRRPEDWLAQFAAGHGTCTNAGGILASRRRMALAMRLWKEHPFTVAASVD